jgi:hypothetical protein
MSPLSRQAGQFPLCGRLPKVSHGIEAEYQTAGIEAQARSARAKILGDSILHAAGAIGRRVNRAESRYMNKLKLIWLTFVQLVGQVWSLPRQATAAIKQKRRQNVRDENEAERLDRIRNPYKYRGR